jgi:predicted metal-dependent phosphoesterase TrpH
LIGDLHLHTHVSDGSMSPSYVVDYAVRSGLDCIAITDHDSMDGAGSARNAASGRIKVIAGVEVSSFDYKNNKKVHLLCYEPKKTDVLFALCKRTIERRDKATLEMVEKVAERYPIDVPTVMKYAKNSCSVFKQHICVALMDMGYTTTVMGELFRELFSKNGFARVELIYEETREIIEILSASGGVCVLAHPGVYNNFDIIDELSDKGLQGIEVWHPRQNEQDTARALQKAEQKGLLKTGGSDFHGAYSTRVNTIGSRVTPNDELIKFISML